MTSSIVPPSRICSKCGIDKPLSEFYKDKNKKSGLHSQCKDCGREYQQNNREQIREYQREWNQTNRERVRERDQEYYIANRERILEHQREYNSANRERRREYYREYSKANRKQIREKGREYYAANREQRLEHSREHYQANRERYQERHREYHQAKPQIKQASSHRRRAREKQLPADFTAEHMQVCLNYFHHTCAVCGSQLQDLFGEVCLHWDHWIPISASDCPGTIPQNMLCLCNGCNLTKHAKMPDEWLRERFGKRKAKQIMTRIQTYFETLKS